MPSDLTDTLADAIIGALLIAHYAGKASQTASSVVHGRGIPMDVTPKPGTKVFTPDGKPPTKVTPRRPTPTHSYYSGSADAMERQSQKVIDQTETVPGEFE